MEADFSDTDLAWMAWSDGYLVTLEVTLGAETVPTEAAWTGVCFGIDLFTSASNNGAYCIEWQATEDPLVADAFTYRNAEEDLRVVYYTPLNWSDFSTIWSYSDANVDRIDLSHNVKYNLELEPAFTSAEN